LTHRRDQDLLPDIYVRSDVELDHLLWCYAALLYAGDSAGIAISGLSAAYVHGVHLLPLRASPAELTLPPESRLAVTRPHLRVVRSVLDAADVVSTGLLRVTSPVRTAFDLARRLPRMDAVAAVDAMLFGRRVSSEEIAEYLAKHPTFRGVARASALLPLVEPLSESPMESRCRLVLIDGGLPRPVAQYEVRVHGRLIARLDLAYPRKRVGIEYEGDHHRERSTFRRDVARGNALREAGWTIVRVTADDVLRNSEQMLRQIRRLI
jgi:Protein of unknown function (DUF559)/AbiEi antitoxin C-terminal domain